MSTAREGRLSQGRGRERNKKISKIQIRSFFSWQSSPGLKVAILVPVSQGLSAEDAGTKENFCDTDPDRWAC